MPSSSTDGPTTPTRRQSILDAYSRDTPVKQITREYHISLRSLYQLLQEEGACPRNQRVSAGTKMEAVEAYIAGEKVQDILHALGISNGTLYQALADYEEETGDIISRRYA